MENASMPNMIPVVSSQIFSIGYDEPSKTLYVRFKDRRTEAPTSLYSYANVDADLYGQLMNAPSIGSFFNGALKYNSQHPYSKIE